MKNSPNGDDSAEFLTVPKIQAELQNLQSESTPLGQLALILAERIDSREDSGSALAALARQLTEVLAEIKGQSTVKQASKLDELRERRKAKRHA